MWLKFYLTSEKFSRILEHHKKWEHCWKNENIAKKKKHLLKVFFPIVKQYKTWLKKRAFCYKCEDGAVFFSHLLKMCVAA